MNRAIIMGRLTRDPEVRYTQGSESMAIARYTLAVNRQNKKEGQQAADFISCVAFKNHGEFAEKYFHQGQRVLVSGRIQTGSYTNREGQKVYTTEIVVDSQEFADSKDAGGKTNAAGNGQEDENGFMNIPEGVDDAGLPFN